MLQKCERQSDWNQAGIPCARPRHGHVNDERIPMDVPVDLLNGHIFYGLKIFSKDIFGSCPHLGREGRDVLSIEGLSKRVRSWRVELRAFLRKILQLDPFWIFVGELGGTLKLV